MSKQIEVTGCYSCPLAFRNNETWVCGLSGAGNLKLPIDKNGILENCIPDKCPLIKEPITIKIKP